MNTVTAAKELLFAFFERMRQWELECLAADRVLRRRNASTDDWETLKDSQFLSLQKIYADCALDMPDRKDGMTYGDPPEYDPTTEVVISVEEADHSVIVTVKSQN